MANLSRKQTRQIRHRRVRRKAAGTAAVPRMSVMISSRHMYVQFIDDDCGKTLAHVASTKRPDYNGTTVDAARAIGLDAAAAAQENGIKRVVVDRGGFRYHGRVKAVVEAAREGGLIMSTKETT